MEISLTSFYALGIHNCSVNEFRCKYGGCIRSHSICDMISDCADESDEDPVLCRKFHSVWVIYCFTFLYI